MKKIIMMLFFASIIFIHVRAQDSTKNKIKTMIEAKDYFFEPNTATAARGHSRHLTPGYFLQLKNDTLKVYLPYYGRAYSAPINTSDVGYDFTTTDYSYDVTKGKKNSYKISIKTKDKVYNIEFYLTIYDNGTTYLQTNSSDRQSMSYNGDLKENK